MIGPTQPPAIRHHWACGNRRIVEHVETDPTGQTRVITACTNCGATDRPGVTR